MYATFAENMVQKRWNHSRDLFFTAEFPAPRPVFKMVLKAGGKKDLSTFIAGWSHQPAGKSSMVGFPASRVCRKVDTPTMWPAGSITNQVVRGLTVSFLV